MEALPFLEDIYPKDLLYAAIIRSPVAKGILKNIEISELPENFTLVTAKDIPGKNKLYNTDIPILADEKLSYIGEPAALLLGNDKTKLEDIIDRCMVIADEEPPVFSCGNDDGYTPLAERQIIIGSPADELSENSRIVKGNFITGIQEHWYAEPAGAVSFWDDKKNLVVRTSTQWANHVKRSVSIALGLNPSVVLVEPTAINLHMDGKLWYPSLISCLAALGTFITNKPVRLILTREEDFFYTPKRCGSDIEIASFIDEKGNITSSKIDISVNLGAYGVNEKEILDQMCLGSLGLYNFKNLKLTARANRTNIPVQGPFTGFGLAQGLFAIERHISQIADVYEIDPACFRANNADKRAILPLQQTVKNNNCDNELFEAVTKMSDYYRKWSSFELLRKSRTWGTPAEKGENPRGIGIAAGFQGNGLLYYSDDKGSYSVEVTLTKESILEIKSNITSPEDYQKIWQKIASETMSIQPEMVRIVSAAAPDSGPSCASRNITVITKLVERCCLAIRKQRFHDPLPITVKRSVRPQEGFFRDKSFKVMDVSGFTKPALAAAVVEVTVDLVECLPKIRGIWLAVDGGKIISKHRAKRSLMRNVTQALGWAFAENIEYVNGILPRKQYNNFNFFSPLDMPPVKIEFLLSDTSEAKGIGELPFNCIPAAFLQAVSQAMDHCYKSIPLKKNDIWEMVRIRNDHKQNQAVK
ncbi:MAG: molybdopterin-dependent oxidoreductase [Treponema sp.]|nr:molybdopterin-dependent oxidoreductase [Treponema sp.]